jgi:putative nucleotidyltransferase with HDIG domain
MDSLEAIMPAAEDFARENSVDNIVHGWEHTLRVIAFADEVNREVEADPNIVRCAVLFHDIGHRMRDEDHHIVSARIAYDFFIRKNIDRITIGRIRECIICHSRRYSTEKPLSQESRVLYDADGMDLYGPIGLLRALVSASTVWKGYSCIIEKLEWRVGQKANFYSRTGRQYVERNAGIIEAYLRELRETIS